MNRHQWMVVAVALTCFGHVRHADAQLGSFFSRGPKVPEISVEQLRTLQLDRQPTQQAFVLVDVRSEQELAVSIIPGAITQSQYERNQDRYRGRTVITYCTVGGRSHSYAKQLIKQGTKAMNFKGSILGWCQANLPLITLRGEPTRRVHVYSSRYRVPAQYDPVW